MTTRKLFNYELNDSFIDIEHNENEGWINKYYISNTNIKIFCILLKHIQSYFKSNNINIYTQLVSQTDWDEFISKNNKWKIKEVQETKEINNIITITIYCLMDNMIECIMTDLGYPPIDN